MSHEADNIIIGGGNLTQALLTGWLASPTPRLWHVVDPNQSIHSTLKDIGCSVSSTLPTNINKNATIIIAVKPQILPEAIKPLRNVINDQHSIISVAAGIRTDKIAAYLNNHGNITRVMPNIAAAARCSFSGIFSPAKTQISHKTALSLFTCLGAIAEVKNEDEMDALTVIAGSGLAYWYQTLKSLIAASESLPISMELASKANLHTLQGAAQLLALESNLTYKDLCSKVVSKNGTTAAALNIIEKDLALLWKTALNSAYTKAIDLNCQHNGSP